MVLVKSSMSLKAELENFDPFVRFEMWGVDNDPPLSTWYSAWGTYIDLFE